MKDKLIYPKDMLRLDRSKWKMPHRHKTSFMHGDLVPLDSIEILPGDTISIDVASMIRMSTPIVPVMDSIEMHIAAYFVPNRLSFEHWEELCGANKTGAWTTGMSNVVVPYLHQPDFTSISGGRHAQGSFTQSEYAAGGSVTNWDSMTLLDYFVGGINSTYADINLLRFRDYYLVWNEHYRSQVVSAPIAVDLSSTNGVIVGENGLYTCLRKPEPLGKFPDYFTKALPEPQKGADIQYLSDLLPVGTLISGGSTSGNIVRGVSLTANGTTGDFVQLGLAAASNQINTVPSFVGDLYASTAGMIKTINDLRYAFQLQKFLEKDARFGTRYFEYLNAHYGVTIADSVAQRPQFLGELNFKINIDQVLSTAETTAAKIGQPGANSTTFGKGSLFSFSSVEHGYIIIVGGARHEHTYANTIDKTWMHINKLDFYHPEFANIGEQPVWDCELSGNYVSGNDKDVFGYQEAWAEYRFIPDRVTGLLNPAVTGSLSFWTLADPDYDNGQLLNESFVYEGRLSIARALVTGANGPDYIGNFFFDTTITRVMPVYSIPGFADHH